LHQIKSAYILKVFDIEEDNSNLARSDKNITEQGPVVV